MGTLINLTSRRPVLNEAGEVIFENRYFTNPEAVGNLIRFLLREQGEEKLLGWGAFGADSFSGPEVVIQQFLYVQSHYQINCIKGKRMYFECFTLREQDISGDGWKLDEDDLLLLAAQLAETYYNIGHQVVYALKFSVKKGYCIYFAVNSVSIYNGHKFRTNAEDRMIRENHFKFKLQMRQNLKRYNLAQNQMQYDLKYIQSQGPSRFKA